MLDFQLLRMQAGLNREDTATLFDVTIRTVKAWDQGKQPPRAVFLYLYVLTGRLDHLGADWKGFRFAGNCIESPEGEFIYAWEVRAMRYLLQAAGLSHSKLLHILKQSPYPQKHRPDRHNRPVGITVLHPKGPKAG
jgi:transcriptional regulator with XRE-family HTH domain